MKEGLPSHLAVLFTSPKEDVYDPFLENVVIGILQIPSSDIRSICATNYQ